MKVMSFSRLCLWLVVTVVMSGCSFFDTPKDDRSKAGLKGDVKVFTEYEGVVVSGNLTPGKIVCRTQYDKRGNQICVELFNEEGHVYETRSTSYDENNHKTVSQVHDGEGALERSLIFSYDEHGHVTECEDFNGRGILMYRAQNTYDSLGRLTANVIRPDGKFISKTTFAYDEFGNDTLICSYEKEDTVSRKEYRDFDADGNMVELNVYDASDMLLSQSVYRYDAEGRLAESSSYSGYAVMENRSIFQYDDSDWCGNYRKILLYDKDSVLIGGTLRKFEYY